MSGAAAKVTTKMSRSAAAAAVAAAQAQTSNAPRSVLSIPTVVRHGPVPISAGAAIRQVGATRRVFLFRPYLTAEEMDGLAYRISMLGRNESLSSVLIANVNDEEVENEYNVFALPESAIETERKGTDIMSYLHVHDNDDSIPLVAAGYDPRILRSQTPHEKRETLEGMMKLALATNGSPSTLTLSDTSSTTTTTVPSRIPVISLPSGRITDGGYALALSSYVLATSRTSFQILNPQRGLSLDPVGFSHILPRLGTEFNQPSAKYPVGNLLAYASFRAGADDMIETGLATHYVDGLDIVSILERGLGEMRPWGQQGLVKAATRVYEQQQQQEGEESREKQQPPDVNAKYRNVAVANLLHSVCSYDAAGQEMTDASDEIEFWRGQTDPSLVFEHEQPSFYGDRESMLLNVAATFDTVFNDADGSGVEGILERLKECAATEIGEDDVEQREVVDIAKDLLQTMEAQSPLALKVVHELMKEGKKPKETLETCMQRELNVQMKLLEMDDYNNWVDSGLKEGEFTNWKHSSVQDVTKDEIEELFST